jgi:hypothetical protein
MEEASPTLQCQEEAQPQSSAIVMSGVQRVNHDVQSPHEMGGTLGEVCERPFPRSQKRAVVRYWSVCIQRQEDPVQV